MKNITVAIAFLLTLACTGTVYAGEYKADLTFAGGQGNVIVVDSFGTLRKSDLTADQLTQLVRNNEKMARELEELKRKGSSNEKVAHELEDLKRQMRGYEKLSRELDECKRQLRDLERRVK